MDWKNIFKKLFVISLAILIGYCVGYDSGVTDQKEYEIFGYFEGIDDAIIQQIYGENVKPMEIRTHTNENFTEDARYYGGYVFTMMSDEVYDNDSMVLCINVMNK
ncbi:MAG: hypothetical protein KAS32_03765 [Candidatus Peribacteraceae bacterium]|nr:hypothetical protein [Candidatus Peribacteraceae bacterium]